MNAVVDEQTDRRRFLPLALRCAVARRQERRAVRAAHGLAVWELLESIRAVGVGVGADARYQAGLPEWLAARHDVAAWRIVGGVTAVQHRAGCRVFDRHSCENCSDGRGGTCEIDERAVAGLQAFFLHAASRNGYTIPEVAGLFPDRLDRTAYERLVRESPWTFGMYDDKRYLDGHISFTEPLGAAAGEALWLIRDALVCEERDENGLPNGELLLLANVPSDWFAEGKEIALEDLPDGVRNDQRASAIAALSSTGRGRR